MFLTLDNFFSDESSVIQVDSSVIDVSEFEDEGDKTFLVSTGTEILRINGKAEYAKAQICRAIDARAEDAKGRLIYEIQERYKNTPELKGGLFRYFHSLGFWATDMEKMGLLKPEGSTSLSTAFNWANAYRAALEMQQKLAGLYSPEELQAKVAALPAQAIGKAYTALSEADREALYLRAAEGDVPTQREITEIIKSPEAKLSKAEELLERAKARKAEAEARWEEVKADPEIRSRVNGKLTEEYNKAGSELSRADRSVANLEEQVAQLQRELDAKSTELDKFKFDDDTRREQRIKSLMAGLTIGVPQTIADLQKYFVEAEYYPDRIRGHLNDQVKMLADMCGDYLASV
jgi:hypothetical protein